MARLLMGSVAEKVVRTAPCPVLTVRHPRTRIRRQRCQHARRRSVMITLKHILVATDFSEPSDAALTYGRELARTFQATLHLVHVGTPVSSVVYGA
jgi:nucleotide-binding universal stress UspA family protein